MDFDTQKDKNENNPEKTHGKGTLTVLITFLLAFVVAGMLMEYQHKRDEEAAKPVSKITFSGMASAPAPAPVVSVTSTTLPSQMNMDMGDDDKDSPACHCDPDALDFAVMDRLRDYGLEDYDSYYAGDIAALNLEQKKRVKLGVWVSQLKDRCLQKAYQNWLDYYNSDLLRAFDAVGASKSGKDTEAAEQLAKYKRDIKAAAQCKRDGTVPRIKLEKINEP